MSELVSVLMVVRNEEQFVSAAIRSVLEQTHQTVELIVVDGRSSDGTRTEVQRWARVDPRVRLVDNPERTISWGLNRGLEVARGHYVARLDGHSTWPPDFIETARSFLTENPRAGGVGGLRLGVGSGVSGRSIAAALSSRVGVGNSLYHYSSVEQLTDHVTSGVYRYQAVRCVGGWDTSLIVNEDVDFDLQILKAGWDLYHYPQLVTSWRVRESLRALARQYRRYGRGKAHMVKKNGFRAIRARHLAAPALIVSIALSLSHSVLRRDMRTATLPASYLAILMLESSRLRKKVAGTSCLRITLALVCMHLGWGIGFLEASVLHMQPQAASQNYAQPNLPASEELEVVSREV